MTSVHPIADDTIVEINEDGVRSPDQQVEGQSSILESNRDQGDHDAIIDKVSTYSTGQTVHSKSDELNGVRNANHSDSESNRSGDRTADAFNAAADKATTTSESSIPSPPNTGSTRRRNSAKGSIRNSTKEDSISSGSSSSSSATSSDDEQDKQTKELSLFDRGQTIFKPIINGLTNSFTHKEKFTFTWSNLTYFVFATSRFGLRKKKKFIFTKINGEVKSNQLFGLLGPSGAGKSSLLDCLSFKRLKNVSGDIKINGKFDKYKMAYIPQHDEYFEDLTCLETLTYASKLKNGSASIEDTLLTLNNDVIAQQKKFSKRFQSFHHRVANNVLNLLGLSEHVNTYAGRLSGGQKKRLSIAQELVVKPHIIFLDEPTSGLDSNSSYQCISLLSQLAKQSTPIAIVATIHQPNPKTLQLFDQIYVLSSYGQVIYNASPNDVVSRLHQENIDVPIHYNPADYLLELASGEYDKSYIERMVDQVKRTKVSHEHLNSEHSKDALKGFEMHSSETGGSQFWTLLNRCFLLTMRSPMLTTNRVISHFLLALFIGWIFGPNVGKQADCPAKLSLVLDAEELSKLTNYTVESSKNVMDNMASIFFGILVMLLGSLLPTLVTFPLEVKILQKETHNGWYGVKPYFFARLIADLPLQIIVPFMYVSITYILNGQLMEPFRFINFSLIFILTAVIAQCHGIIVGAIFSQDIMTAVYLGPITALPLLLFSGFLVRIERMPWIIRPFTYVSYMRFAFEGIVISIYGFNRCGDEAVEQITRVRKQLGDYFTNLMNFVKAGINCEEDWDKADLRMGNDNWTTISHSDLRLDLNSLKESITIDERSERLMVEVKQPENDTENGINTLFNNLLDVMFNSQLDDNGKIVPRVMQLFDLKDAFLYRTIIALLIFTVITRIMSYYIIRYKANLRG